MGPEEFKVTPGRMFMVPLGADGQPHGEPIEWGPLQEVNFDGGFDWGHEEGLDGGLLGGPDGALVQTGKLSYTMELELSSGEFSYPLMAILMGKTEAELRDLVQWARECEWLEKLTGLNWGHFE